MRVDDSSFQKKIKEALKKVETNTLRAVNEIAYEALRLSQREVPHDLGTLQNSGMTEKAKIGVGGKVSGLVGYNTVYAARLHEHPEFIFQKGRKGKYLEDPLRNNVKKFRQHFANLLK